MGDGAAPEERKRLLLLAAQARIAQVGYPAEATTATYAEIGRIARATGDDGLLIDGLYGKWAGHYVPGRLPVALAVADEIRAAGARAEDLARALGHRLRGTVLTMMGEIEAATDALSAAAECCHPARHAGFASRFGQDVGVAGKCYRIGVLTLAGRLDGAAGLAREVPGDVERLAHPHTTGYALGHLAVFLSAAGILPLGEEIARNCVAASERNRTPLWSALGRASLALAHVQEGEAKEAASEFRDALATLESLDFTVFITLLLPANALSLGEAGDLPGAEGNSPRPRVSSTSARRGSTRPRSFGSGGGFYC